MNFPLSLLFLLDINLCNLLQAKEGETVEFICKVIGEPFPELVWYLNGQVITTTDNFIITEVTDEKMHMLRILKVMPNNAGTYQVTATNPYGTVTCSATLNVEGIIFIHSFIHSGYFYSASSNPLLLRGAPDTARMLCRS